MKKSMKKSMTAAILLSALVSTPAFAEDLLSAEITRAGQLLKNLCQISKQEILRNASERRKDFEAATLHLMTDLPHELKQEIISLNARSLKNLKDLTTVNSDFRNNLSEETRNRIRERDVAIRKEHFALRKERNALLDKVEGDPAWKALVNRYEQQKLRITIDEERGDFGLLIVLWDEASEHETVLSGDRLQGNIQFYSEILLKEQLPTECKTAPIPGLDSTAENGEAKVTESAITTQTVKPTQPEESPALPNQAPSSDKSGGAAAK